MKVIQYNPFRYLGLFANATLKEQTAAVTQLKAFARVGQKVDNPLRLPHCFGELSDDEQTIIENESLLALPNEKEQHAFFWFAHGPDAKEDLEAIDFINQGNTAKAIIIWEKRSDREALQNLMVTALLREDLKEATRLAQRLHHKEQDISRFVLSLIDEFKWLTMQTLHDYTTGNTQWTAVLKDMHLSACRKNIEDCLNKAKHVNDLDTYEELYGATKDLDQLRDILGSDDVTYQTLADQLANALVMEEFAPFRVKDPFKWFDKAYEISVEEETKTLVICTTLSFFEEILDRSIRSKSDSKEYKQQILALISYAGPITELKEELQKAVDKQKTINLWKIGGGALGLLILIVLHITLEPIFIRNKSNRPPEITLPKPVQLPDSIPFHPIDIPTVPDISNVSFDQTFQLPEETEIDSRIQKMDSFYRNMSEEEMQELLNKSSESDTKSSDNDTIPSNSTSE